MRYILPSNFFAFCSSGSSHGSTANTRSKHYKRIDFRATRTYTWIESSSPDSRQLRMDNCGYSILFCLKHQFDEKTLNKLNYNAFTFRNNQSRTQLSFPDIKVFTLKLISTWAFWILKIFNSRMHC